MLWQRFISWQRLVSWVITRGVVSGAILGALLGAFLMFIYGAIIGFVVGAIMGAALGFVNGILLTEITKRLYAPPNSPSIYPKVVYTVAILTNTLPFFIIFGVLGAIPALATGIAAAYFAGGFLEYADSLVAQIPAPHLPAHLLSRAKN